MESRDKKTLIEYRKNIYINYGGRRMKFAEKIGGLIGRKLTDRETEIANRLEQSGQHTKYTDENIKDAFAALASVEEKQRKGR